MDRRDGGILQHLLNILSSFMSVWIMNFLINVTLLSFPESMSHFSPSLNECETLIHIPDAILLFINMNH